MGCPTRRFAPVAAFAVLALLSCEFVAPRGHLNPADPDYDPAADPNNTATALPVAPTHLLAVATEVGKVSLTWEDNSPFNTDFLVERKAGAAGTYAEIGTVTDTAGTTGEIGAYVDATVAPETLYYYRVSAHSSVGYSAYCTEVAVTSLVGLVPDIRVVQNTAPIASGTGTFDFGAVYVGGAAAQATFTIHNDGTRELALTGSPSLVAIGGTNAALFAVTAAATTPVAVDGSTTFTITFAPDSAGAKTAMVSIASDDPDENPYTFALAGAGSDRKSVV